MLKEMAIVSFYGVIASHACLHVEVFEGACEGEWCDLPWLPQSYDEVYNCLKGGSGNSEGKRLAISMVEEA
ncbi:hypothetical protein Tco_0617635 [Tanacetum coccineum]